MTKQEIVQFINDEYLAFCSETKGKTRDLQDLRFGQRIYNKLYNIKNVKLIERVGYGIYYVEKTDEALHIVLDMIEGDHYHSTIKS